MKKGAPAHECDGRREEKLDPVLCAWRKDGMKVEDMTDHIDDDQRRGEDKRDPEAPRHVGALRDRRPRRGRHFQLERHAANRTGARMILPNFGMHRADVNRARGRGRDWARIGEIAGGIGEKFFAAAGAAEEIVLAVMLGSMFRSRGIDAHAADRVLGECAMGCRVMMTGMGFVLHRFRH